MKVWLTSGFGKGIEAVVDLDEGATAADLAASQGIDAAAASIKVNRAGADATTKLSDGDRVMFSPSGIKGN